MARKNDSDYFDPAPGIEEQAYQYPFDNKYEIFTLRKDLQPTAPPGQLHAWGNKKSNENPGGTTIFWTTDTKFMSKLFNPMSVVETGCACIAELNYTLDQSWPLAFGFTPIARKRQFSLIMQNHGISIIADLYVPEKFADLNLVGIPDGYAAFGTRAHSSDIEDARKYGTKPLIDIRYERACSVARKGRYCLDESARRRLSNDSSFPLPLLNVLKPLHDKEYGTERTFVDALNDAHERRVGIPLDGKTSENILNVCSSGELNVFMVYGGGEKVRQWVIEKNQRLTAPHVWWFPDAMDTVRVNRKKEAISPN